MDHPNAADVKKGISLLWETLQCPICLDLLTAPISTKCDHQFCKFCMMKLLDNTKQNKGNCPVCKASITKRSLQESPGFQKLVAGLQDMIQAYEHDTSTNYFTGVCQRRHLGVADADTCKQCHETSLGHKADNAENTDNDLPRSTTISAQNAFARVMALEDVSPLTAENEGTDSGLGWPLQAHEKKMDGSQDVEMEQTELSEGVKGTLTNKTRGEEATASLDKPQKRSSRRKRKKDEDRDTIVEQRQKRSLEKVAEWLMNVPTEGSLEKASEDACDSDISDSCSSTSTLDVKLYYSELKAKREHPSRALEEQVFGAIYRRGNRSTTAPANTVKPSALSITNSKVSRRKKSSIPPDDFIEGSNTDDKDESDKKEQQLNATSGDILKEAEQICKNKSNTNYVEELTNIPESDNNDRADKAPRLVSDAEAGQHEGKSKRRTRNSSQQLDSDLQEQADTKANTSARKMSDRSRGKLEKGKSAREAKPLVLVGLQGEEACTKARPESEEVQVHIENYPSSEDQATPTARSNRRSRRLQVLLEEVQQGLQKAPANLEAHTPGKHSSAAKDSEGVQCATSPKSEHVTSRRNGCIFDHDIGGIENFSEAPFAGAAPSQEDITTEVPHTETPPETACSDVVIQTSGIESAVADPELKGETKALVYEAKSDTAEQEEDTEQLLRSFKATKRRSFHLGGPSGAKRSRGLDRRSLQSPKAEENDDAGVKPAEWQKAKESDLDDEDVLKDNDIDFVPPSNMDIRKADEASGEPSPLDVGGSASNNGSILRENSALSPNKVSKKAESESPYVSVVPLVVESGICFQPIEISGHSVELDGPPRDSEGVENVSGTSVSPKNSGKHCLDNTIESSLTSDGLGQLVGREDHSVHSSIKSNPRKHRRTQRLESSSESGSSGFRDELPPLAQFFRQSAAPSEDAMDLDEADGCEGGHKDATEAPSRPPTRPSPDYIESSQGSVDLFGTPDECVPVNGTVVSMESSQFSSEVLVTQQKIEMQKELVRLEKLMALVSEVLQEKEADPADRDPLETHQSYKTACTPPVCDLGVHQGPDREEGEPNTQANDSEGVTHPGSSEHGSAAEMLPCAEGAYVSKAPDSYPAAKTTKNSKNSDGQDDKENDTPERDRGKAKMVLVSSGLGPTEQMMVKKFAKRVGARVQSNMAPEVTHIIMSTDEQLVCERTLKYFLGIAGRKWVVSFQWISECFEQRKLLEESVFEVRGDVVNGPNHRGPMRARTTEDSNLLMRGYKICFQGAFTDMTTDQLQSMVELCGASLVRDPLLLDSKQKSHQLVIVQSGSESSTYSSLSKRATVVTRGWLLDTVATYSLQSFSKYAT